MEENKELNESSVATYDGAVNAMTGMGTARDKTAYTTHSAQFLSPVVLSNMYRFDGMAKKLINQPIFDMLKNGRTWTDNDEAIRKEEKRVNLNKALFEAMAWGDVYGGAILVIVIAGQKLNTPLKLETVKKGSLLRLMVIDRNLVVKHEPDMNIASDKFLIPREYEIKSTNGIQQMIHPSRVIELGGDELPLSDRIHITNEYWNQSKFHRYADTLNTFLTVHNAGAKMITEANIDVFSVDALPEITSSKMAQSFERRMELADLGKSVHKVIIKDKNEEFDRSQLNLSGLADMLGVYQTNLSAVTDIPITKLFGTSAKGLNATGEGDERNYHEHIEQRQEQLKMSIKVLDEVIVRSATGTYSNEDYTWNPLQVKDEKEESEIHNNMANAEKIYQELGVLQPTEIRARLKNSGMYEISDINNVSEPTEENQNAESTND